MGGGGDGDVFVIDPAGGTIVCQSIGHRARLGDVFANSYRVVLVVVTLVFI